MSENPLVAIARVIANPTAAAVLDSLMSDRELTISQLAREVGSARSTVSEAVGSLAEHSLVARRRHGRATFVRLAGGDVASAIEALGRLARPVVPVGLTAVRRDVALRQARTCYDHLAGELGVALGDRLVEAGILVADGGDEWSLSQDGMRRLAALGVDGSLVDVYARRPVVRACQDWSERRPHVAGQVGAAICTMWLARGLAHRLPRGRALQVSPMGHRWLAALSEGVESPSADGSANGVRHRERRFRR